MNGENVPQPPPANPSPESGWTYRPDRPSASGSMHSLAPDNSEANDDLQAASPIPEITWTASEFIAHHKSINWYLTLFAVSIVVAVVVYLFTKDIISASVIIIVAILLSISASRKPRTIAYAVLPGGVQIGSKYFPYSEIKSFSIMREGAFSSISFIPLQRFMPPTSLYYEPADEQKIVDLLSQHIPVENRQPDMIDRLATRIRF